MADPSKPIVLAVDDSTLMQDLIKRALGQNYHVLVAGSAIDALATLNHETVSVVLLDICMPGVDGLGLCRTIRNFPQFAGLPIIMLTSKDTVMDKVQGRLAGATEYLTKPFDASQLRQVISRLAGAVFVDEVQAVIDDKEAQVTPQQLIE